MYDAERRAQKARKTLSVLKDYLAAAKRNPAQLTLLDIGCSTGFMTRLYGQAFERVVGVDIDNGAIRHARSHNGGGNVEFLVGDSMSLDFKDGSFDCATCTQIYEHVPDSRRLMEEIYRVLKPGGCCYFAAGNRLRVIEPHYRLPFLSVMPKSLGHLYVKLAGKADSYYETHRSLWGLRKLVGRFEIYDYTAKILSDPVKYHATEMVRPGSLKQRLALLVLSVAYWLCPTYVWVLRKPERGQQGTSPAFGRAGNTLNSPARSPTVARS